MLHKLRRRAEDEKGFTLIELLVVILIIGILAAIAIPTFLNQKSKANDASAESLARNAATAMETYATNNNGSYTNASVTGIANVRLFKGRAMQVGAKSPNTLYDPQLASFSMEGYDVTAARGFIDLFGLPMKVAQQAKRW